MLTLREYKLIISYLAIDVTDEEISEIMDQKIDLSGGGMAVVIIGSAYGFVKEFTNHPQVRFIDSKEVGTDQLANLFPTNAKVVIMTEGVPAYHYTWVTSICNRKNIVYLVRKSTEAVYQSLKSFFPNGSSDKPSVEDVKQVVTHGKLNFLKEMIDFTRSNSEEATRLLDICKSKNISTTHASLTQLVSNERRRKNGGTVPKSARPKLDVSVEILDGMVKQLGDMRDFLIEIVEENRLLKTKLDKFKKAMED